jgi:uncharacterized protein (DUF58 family)
VTDPILARVERRALYLTAAACAVAFVVTDGGWPGVAAVLGGAVLAGYSYWSIKRTVMAITAHVAARAEAGAPPRTPRGVGVAVLRYALLAGMAYVMIARLRLPPIGLLGGASVMVTAAAAELARSRGH